MMQANRSVRGRRPTATKRPSRKRVSPRRRRSSSPAPTANAPVAKRGLGKLFSVQNLQESLKTVGNLRSTVKNWLNYLQQADQLLDTVFVTSNSLRESGVLEKIVKQRGKNLSTEDFTNILIALMNSPVGNQVLKSLGQNSEETPDKPEGES